MTRACETATRDHTVYKFTSSLPASSFRNVAMVGVGFSTSSSESFSTADEELKCSPNEYSALLKAARSHIACVKFTVNLRCLTYRKNSHPDIKVITIHSNLQILKANTNLYHYFIWGQHF